GYKVYLSPDSENAIVHETDDTFYYWKLAACLDNNTFELHEVILNKNLDLKSDQCYYYLTVNEAVDHIHEYIIQY
ncbi:hypothetical protein, partial [Herbiconiux daphne]